MNQIPSFIYATTIPTKKVLQEQLDENIFKFIYYLINFKSKGTLSKNWISTKQGNWFLKIRSKKYEMLYIAPFVSYLDILLSVNEKEKKVLMDEYDLRDIYPKIKEAPLAGEYYQIHFTIRTHEEFDMIVKAINRLILMREANILNLILVIGLPSVGVILTLIKYLMNYN